MARISFMIRIEKDLKREFKSICAKKDITLSEAAEAAIAGWVLRQPGLPGEKCKKN